MGVAAINIGAVASSAVVAAVVAAISSFLTQRYLLERKARVDYEYGARLRLHQAIGPLRMQLLFAARDVVRRTRGHAGRAWVMDPHETYARSFIYRLLRPLALAQIIERQMAFADFSVDPSAVALLLFNTASERVLTGRDVVNDRTDVDWLNQSQHVFRDNLRAAAAALIETGPDGPRVVEYVRFAENIRDFTPYAGLRELSEIFAQCQRNLTENPIFWVRIVGYAYICTRFIAQNGLSVGFEDVPIPVPEMLSRVDDESISGAAQKYEAIFQSIIAQGL